MENWTKLFKKIYMKKVILSAIIVIACVLQMNAQDKIYLTNGDEIKAKIEEISETEIKYHLWDNQGGPMRSLSVGNVFMIVYENGQKEVFTTSQQSVQYSVTTTNADNVSVQNKVNLIVVKPEKGDNVVTKAIEWRGEYLPRIAYGKVFDPIKGKMKKRYYGDGIVFREKEFAKFIEMYCGDASTYYKRSWNYCIVGCVMIFVGIVPAIPFIILTMTNDSKVLPTYNTNCAGTPVNSMGSVGYIELIEADEDTDCIK